MQGQRPLVLQFLHRIICAVVKKKKLKYSCLSTGSPLSTELRSNFSFDIYYIKILLLETISTGTRKKVRKGLYKIQFLKAGIKKYDTVARN